MESCKEFKLQIQSLTDGELNFKDKEVSNLFDHLSKCEECRAEYGDLIELNKKVRISGGSMPSDAWVEELEKKRSRTILRRVGYSLILVPYLIIIGYGFLELFRDKSEGFLIKGSMAAIITGFLILLILTISARVKESKTDKYKEIVR